MEKILILFLSDHFSYKLFVSGVISRIKNSDIANIGATNRGSRAFQTGKFILPRNPFSPESVEIEKTSPFSYDIFLERNSVFHNPPLHTFSRNSLSVGK